MTMLRWIKIALIVAALCFGALLLYGYARTHPEDMPWTRLDLGQPVGAFTGRKLTALRGETDRCHRLLREAGVSFTALPSRQARPQCGYDDAVRLATEGSLDIAFRPASLGVSCPVAASLTLWEWHVVQPAALRHFGRKVVAIEHFGSYSCRRTYGRDVGSWSEHATANAVDIAAFRLEDGQRIGIAADWNGEGAEAAFLRDVRDGACRLFATVLSPDYNRAHHDHLHFDHAERGAMGWRGCR